MLLISVRVYVSELRYVLNEELKNAQGLFSEEVPEMKISRSASSIGTET